MLNILKAIFSPQGIFILGIAVGLIIAVIKLGDWIEEKSS